MLALVNSRPPFGSSCRVNGRTGSRGVSHDCCRRQRRYAMNLTSSGISTANRVRGSSVAASKYLLRGCSRLISGNQRSILSHLQGGSLSRDLYVIGARTPSYLGLSLVGERSAKASSLDRMYDEIRAGNSGNGGCLAQVCNYGGGVGCSRRLCRH